MRVLIVDDDAVYQMLLKSTVTQLGHEVVTCANGEAAWEEFQRKPAHMVMTDWMMPDVEGPELCRRIRDLSLPAYTYIVLITSLDSQSHYVDGLEAGADDFITKPFQRDHLAARMHVAERILGLRRQLSQLERLLPICMYCKKIRNDQQDWIRVEDYITRRTAETFTHGICPHCYEHVARPAVREALRRRDEGG